MPPILETLDYIVNQFPPTLQALPDAPLWKTKQRVKEKIEKKQQEERRLIGRHRLRESPSVIAYAIFQKCPRLRVISVVCKESGRRFEPLHHPEKGHFNGVKETGVFANPYYSDLLGDGSRTYNWL